MKRTAFIERHLRNATGNEMIISYRHNYIYFRAKKTGSSTIEDVLSHSLGPDDIIAGIRSARISRDGAQRTVAKDVVAHSPAKDIINMVSPEFWSNCFRFASERHPYEKAVSLAYFRQDRQKRKGRFGSTDFDSFLDKTVRSGDYRGFDVYSIDGKPVVTDFIRNETFQADMTRVAERLGIELPDELPKKKANLRTDRRPAADILSAEQKQIIFDKCREEFELLGYER